MTGDLFPEDRQVLAEGATILRGFARDQAEVLVAALHNVASAAPFRHMVTPGGYRMSVAMTNCGTAGWATDRGGYRYDRTKPAGLGPLCPTSFSRSPPGQPNKRGIPALCPMRA